MAESDSAPQARMGSIAAAAATFTAVVAVAVAIWDNVETRRHNRLPVLPYVVLEHVRNDSADITRAEVTMQNAGVGPAMLRGLEVRFPRAHGDTLLASRWGDIAPLILEHGVRIHGWADVDSSTALGVQLSQALLRLQSTGEDSGKRVQRVLDGLQLRLRYTSVYGDTYESTLGFPDS